MIVSVENGKYTIIQDPNGSLRALRYDKEWQDLTGNKMVLALAQEIQNLREQLECFQNGRECPSCGNGAGDCNCYLQ